MVVDPRGYGDTARRRDDGGYTLAGFCDDLLAAADACGIDRFVAWGYSNTAMLCTVLAATAPDRVSALVCGGMTRLVDGTVYDAHATAALQGEGEGHYLPHGRFSWRAARGFWREIKAWQDDGGPRELRCPAVLYYGTEDGVVAPGVGLHPS